MPDRLLGGLTSLERRVCAGVAIVAIILLVVPQTHRLGAALIACVVTLQILAAIASPYRPAAIKDGRLYLRTQSSKQGDRWGVDIANIRHIRIVGMHGSRQLLIYLSDGSTKRVMPPIGVRPNRQLEQFLSTSILAERVEHVQPPSWMDDLRGYDE